MKHEISSDGSNGLLPSLSAKIIPSTARKSELFRIASEKLPNLSRHKTNPDQLNSFISKRLEEIKTENIKISSKKCGKVRIYAANTTAGISQFHNEDRVRIILNIKKPETIPQDKWPHSSFYGIYDGNNGKFCAEFLKQNLHNRIFTDSNFPFRPKKAILSGFHKTEEEFLSIAEENNDFSGSSALICLILGNKCYIAQTGDTRAILSASNGNKIFQITEDHNLKNQSEKDRIISAGGKIVCNFVLDKAGNRIPKGGYRIMPSNLCITRSLGNFQAKTSKFGGDPEVIIPTPVIKSFKIHNDYDFILMCSQGVTQKMSTQEIANCIWATINNLKGRDCETRVASGIAEIMSQAFIKKSDDNITVIFIGFKSLFLYCEDDIKS